MTITEPGIYHIYNRGNNQQKIFFNEDNYFYFLQKCHKYIKPSSEILAWCLMPNHFHFLLEINEKGLGAVQSGGISMTSITNGFRLLQSSYAKGINKQQDRTGNLFQQKTKAKLVSGETDYSKTAFFYIHQNPLEADLVKYAQEWKFSSFQDYLGLRNGTLCNCKKGKEILDLSEIDFETEVLVNLEGENVKNIF